MDSIYTSGKYIETNPTWHAEDSPWKADQIIKIICNNRIHPQTIAEIGCGAGAILDELSKKEYLKAVQFSGYDISPQAVELAKHKESPSVRFFHEDLLSGTNAKHFDILLAIDVFEHVADYMGFLEKCKAKADYKIFHIPLDIHVSSVLRNVFFGGRYTRGHLHYFTADSAIATLKDTGHEILYYFYTSGGLELFKQHPSIKKAIASVPRWLFSKFSIPPQSYGCKPVDEVIRRRRTGGACNLKCYGRKPVEIYFAVHRKSIRRILTVCADKVKNI